MPSRERTITVTEEVFELTREQLLALKTDMWGGNAMRSTAEMIKEAANLLNGGELPRGSGTKAQFIAAMNERAEFLERGIQKVNEVVWPGASWPVRKPAKTSDAPTETLIGDQGETK